MLNVTPTLTLILILILTLPRTENPFITLTLTLCCLRYHWSNCHRSKCRITKSVYEIFFLHDVEQKNDYQLTKKFVSEEFNGRSMRPSYSAVLWQKEASHKKMVGPIHKWAKCVCHLHWYHCSIMMSWLKYLSAGWVFQLNTQPGSK